MKKKGHYQLTRDIDFNKLSKQAKDKYLEILNKRKNQSK